MTAGRWRVWVDTGGTFTDGLALDPAGRMHRAKVLSSSALRGRLDAVRGERALHYRAPWRVPDDFAAGAELRWLERDRSDRIVASRHIALRVSGATGEPGRLETARPLPRELAPGEPFELRFDEEAPVLAARLLTATPAGRPLPEMAVRLATTRGTNALLERRGARCVLLITRGFADLLLIGNQQRADLFALDVGKPPPLYEQVIEVPERLDAAGRVVEALDLEALRPRLERLAGEGFEAAAVALLHSYRNPTHEQQLTRELKRCGIRHIAASADLAPMIKIVPRAETAVVDAYLAPIIEGYLRRVASALGDESRLHVMTSAGGLVGSDRYRAKDSLLSGPAGGVVGAAASGRGCAGRAGGGQKRHDQDRERLIAFDMGGTSTDVSRFDGDYEYVFEHSVGGAAVAGPALAIETVAAGGGSICHRQGRQLKVGPQSAGADPGPACYGAGGPLTLTDVNLLLGRLDPRRFGIPIQPQAAEAAAAALLGELDGDGGESSRESLLAGFLAIADERMAEAIRRISIRRGYDPRRYALVAFGGAGGQHACAVAELLGIATVVAPREAGLLSALGLGAAVIERFAQSQVLAPLSTIEPELSGRLAELAEQASREVAAEGVAPGDVAVRRRLAYLRFAGQEATLELEVGARGEAGGRPLAAAFLERYESLYGYRPPERPIEVDSLRVVSSSRGEAHTAPAPRPPERRAVSVGDRPARDAIPGGERRAFFGDRWRAVPVFDGPDLVPGDRLAGPALVLDDHATLVVGGGWRALKASSGALVLEREGRCSSARRRE